MSDPTQTEETQESDPNMIGTVRVALRFQCVYLVDTMDNAMIVLAPEEAEQLRQWLAEHL